MVSWTACQPVNGSMSRCPCLSSENAMCSSQVKAYAAAQANSIGFEQVPIGHVLTCAELQSTSETHSRPHVSTDTELRWTTHHDFQMPILIPCQVALILCGLCLSGPAGPCEGCSGDSGRAPTRGLQNSAHHGESRTCSPCPKHVTLLLSRQFAPSSDVTLHGIVQEHLLRRYLMAVAVTGQWLQHCELTGQEYHVSHVELLEAYKHFLLVRPAQPDSACLQCDRAF